MLHDIEKRTLGINFSPTASALVWAPLAKSASILINGKTSLASEKQALGYWGLDPIDIKPGDNYQFVIDAKSCPDPASLFQPEGVHGSSQAFNLEAFEWNDNAWKGISPEELIIYELHIGTFNGSGTFNDAIEKISYLKELGITAIEMMPVAQFPGSRNWGYDGVFPFAVQNSYGGPEGLQNLVDAFHQQGLAVILDVVYNHLGPEGNYLWALGPYFTDKYKTPWGKAINFDDEWCDGVRKYYIENALMWLRDFHIDGLRLDAVHAIKDFSAKHILEEISENVKRLNELTGKVHFLIGESDLNDVRYINPPEKGGYGLDLQWCDEFHHAIHPLVTKEQYGYYSDFGKMGHLVKSFNDAFVYDGIYSENRKRTFGNKTTGLPGFKFVVFAQNHDQIGNRMLGERLSAMVDYNTLKLVAGTMFMSPFTPFIFMGEEYGETNPFLYFTSHEDKRLIHMVREGRKKEFAYFNNEGEPPDPQAVETFNQSKLQWDNHTEKQTKLLAFYKELIRLRKNHPVLKTTDRHGVRAELAQAGNAIVLHRQHHENLIVCIMNFEEKEVSIELPATNKPLYTLLNSAEEDPVNPHNMILTDLKIKIKAKSMIVLSDVGAHDF